MNWLMILIEAVAFLGLFTAMVMIPTIKNPVLGVHTVPLFVAVGAYNTFSLDWVLFVRLKVFRVPGTEHMDKEYAQKWFHVKGMLIPGSLFALIIGQLVGTAVAVIK